MKPAGRRLRLTFLLLAVATLTIGIFAFRKEFFLSGQRDPQLPLSGKSGVIFWNKAKAYDGINLVIPYNRRVYLGCNLMDMAGKNLMHLPGNLCQLGTNGLALTVDVEGAQGLEAYLQWRNKEFNVQWTQTELPVHHDIFIDVERSEIFVPVFEPKNPHSRLLVENGGCVDSDRNTFQGIRGYDLNGREIFRWRTIDHLDELFEVLGPMHLTCGQKYQAMTKINGVFVIDRRLSDTDDKIFIPGNLLVSLDLCSCLIVVDRGSGKVLWSYFPAPRYQKHVHHVSLTKSGGILYFKNLYDNAEFEAQDPADMFSEIEIVDPYTKKPLWSYRAKRTGAFFADWGGSAQELPNGNILVTQKGAAFEITREKEIVWEWINPVRGPDNEPDDVYRVTRVPHSTWDLYD